MPAKFIEEGNNEGRIIIKEGKYHQVKRMISMCNGEVTYLKRIKFGPLDLDESLKEGEYRFLSNLELDSLKNR